MEPAAHSDRMLAGPAHSVRATLPPPDGNSRAEGSCFLVPTDVRARRHFENASLWFHDVILKGRQVDHFTTGIRDLDQVAGRIAHEHLHLAIGKLTNFSPRPDVDRVDGLCARENPHEVRHDEAEVPPE